MQEESIQQAKGYMDQVQAAEKRADRAKADYEAQKLVIVALESELKVAQDSLAKATNDDSRSLQAEVRRMQIEVKTLTNSLKVAHDKTDGLQVVLNDYRISLRTLQQV